MTNDTFLLTKQQELVAYLTDPMFKGKYSQQEKFLVRSILVKKLDGRAKQGYSSCPGTVSCPFFKSVHGDIQ